MKQFILTLVLSFIGIISMLGQNHLELGMQPDQVRKTLCITSDNFGQAEENTYIAHNVLIGKRFFDLVVIRFNEKGNVGLTSIGELMKCQNVSEAKKMRDIIAEYDFEDLFDTDFDKNGFKIYHSGYTSNYDGWQLTITVMKSNNDYYVLVIHNYM